MKRLALLLAILAFSAGCIVGGKRGSQAVEFGLDGARPADGGGYDNGTPQDMRGG